MKSHPLITTFVELLREIDNTIEAVNQAGANLIWSGEYDQTEDVLEMAKKLKSVQHELNRIYTEVNSLELPGRTATNSKKKKPGKRVRKGKRAPQELYKVPLLQSLVELGGSGSPREVEELAYPKLEPVLTDYDYTPLASFGNKPRWLHRLGWTRYVLVQAGHLSAESPRGVWEITPAGRDWLADHERQTSFDV